MAWSDYIEPGSPDPGLLDEDWLRWRLAQLPAEPTRQIPPTTQQLTMPSPSFRPAIQTGGGLLGIPGGPMSAEQADAMREGSLDLFSQASLLGGGSPVASAEARVLAQARPRGGRAPPPPSRAGSATSPAEDLIAEPTPSVVADPGGLLGPIKAYHGSPHQFDAFDMSKIGTGEGAQAYGHGMYLAENEGVARSYRDQLAKDPRDTLNEYLAGIRNFHDPGDPAINADAIRTGLGRHDDLAMRQIAADPQSVNDIVSVLRGYDAARGSHTDEAMNAFGRLDKVMPPKSKGHMYQVNVNADPERFLHWDKPLSEQHPDVQKAVKNVGVLPDPVDVNTAGHFGYSLNEFKTLTPEYQQALIAKLPENHVNYAGDPPGWQIHTLLADKLRAGGDLKAGHVAATNALRQAGVPGIRYLDQGSRGAGEGSHNYVVFDPATMEIIRRYGLAGLLGGGAASAGLLGDGS